MMDTSTSVPSIARVAQSRPWDADAELEQPRGARQASAFLRLVQNAEESNRAAFSEMEFWRATLANRPAAEVPSTKDMLRMQTAMQEFNLRVRLTARVADEVGRAVQAITQRS
jgi:hypothetical protein